LLHLRRSLDDATAWNRWHLAWPVHYLLDLPPLDERRLLRWRFFSDHLSQPIKHASLPHLPLPAECLSLDLVVLGVRPRLAFLRRDEVLGARLSSGLLGVNQFVPERIRRIVEALAKIQRLVVRHDAFFLALGQFDLLHLRSHL